MKFNGCEITNSINLIRSSLGDLTFFDLDITDKQTINISNSNCLETKFVNVRWQNGHILNSAGDDEVETIESKFALRESYRQLKANYINNGNTIESLEFKRHELTTHYEIVKFYALKSISRRQSILKHIGNFLILWTHKSASDFSQNIWRPLLLLFVFHFIFFNILMYTSLSASWNLQDPDSTTMINLTNQYFDTLLPTHSNVVNDDNSVGIKIPGFIDFMMRLSSGLFIFYFISASRKYHQS